VHTFYIKQFVLVALAGLVLAGPRALPATSAQAYSTVKLATWNMEWLIAPADFRALQERCAKNGAAVGGNERRLPCDVAYRFERALSDFNGLARYAKALDADVIALQEVDGPGAARLVFKGYEFCFTRRRHLQNNGFAIRAGLPHRCGNDLTTLSLNDSVRRGAQLVLFPGQPHELRLLSVHLKAGCRREGLNSSKKSCRDLARQVPALEAWIDEQARAGRPFAVLGDFNRDLLTEGSRLQAAAGAGVWPQIDDGDPPEADLLNAAEGERFLNCTPGQHYPGYIDFILLSRTLGNARVPHSFTRVTYRPADAHRLKLSDHCPVGVSVRLPGVASRRQP
jgi:endonuclease/exonuclease/phosphatase family metal-dependent hydrolase